MKQVEICKECGHKRVAYKHHLNKPLANALAQLVEFYKKNKRPANLQKDLSLTKNQYNNFQKLQYFELVFRLPASGWIPTNKGEQFIFGEAPSPTSVTTIESEIIRSQSMGMMYIYQIDEKAYKTRESYQEEKGLKDPTLFDY